MNLNVAPVLSGSNTWEQTMRIDFRCKAPLIPHPLHTAKLDVISCRLLQMAALAFGSRSATRCRPQ